MKFETDILVLSQPMSETLIAASFRQHVMEIVVFKRRALTLRAPYWLPLLPPPPRLCQYEYGTSMAVVAVPFILYLVRFCSSKSCKKYGTRSVRVPYCCTVPHKGWKNNKRTYRIQCSNAA